MTKLRVPETDHGIQGEITVAQYDQMQRGLRLGTAPGILAWNGSNRPPTPTWSDWISARICRPWPGAMPKPMV